MLSVAVMASTVGDMLLSRGMHQMGAVESAHPRALLGMVCRVARNRWVVGGVLLLIVYFVLFLTALSREAVSLVVPFTSATYVTTALLARVFLHERISRRRWAGILMIAFGVLLVWRG